MPVFRRLAAWLDAPKEMPDWLPPKRALIPGVLACLALLGVGLVAGSHIGGSAKAAPGGGVYTTTISGRIVTVNGKAAKVLIPAKTIRRNGTTITIPAHTVAITDVQTVSGPARTIDGTVFRTVRFPVTITGPGSTVTATETITGPGTTIVSTVTDTTTDTVTQTVTAPPST